MVFTWTPTGSTYADGYELRYTAGGTSRTVAVPQRSTTSTSFSVSSGVTYVFTLVDVTLELDQRRGPDPSDHRLPVKRLRSLTLTPSS